MSLRTQRASDEPATLYWRPKRAYDAFFKSPCTSTRTRPCRQQPRPWQAGPLLLLPPLVRLAELTFLRHKACSGISASLPAGQSKRCYRNSTSALSPPPRAASTSCSEGFCVLPSTRFLKFGLIIVRIVVAFGARMCSRAFPTQSKWSCTAVVVPGGNPLLRRTRNSQNFI